MALYPPASTRLGHGGQPEDHGLLAWSWDVGLQGSGALIATAGTVQGARIYLPRTLTVSNLVVYVNTVGATLTSGNNRAAFYNSAGTLLGTTADQSVAWVSTGTKLMAITPVVCPAGYYDLVFWYNGTTAPQLWRGTTSNAANANLSGAAQRFFSTSDVSKTTTAPATLGTKTGTSLGWWVAVN